MGQFIKRDFPFDIGQVAAILNLTVRRQTSQNITVDCPFCNNGKKGKMNLSLTENLYRCNYNEDHHGGVVQLYARLMNRSNTEAYSDIVGHLGCGTSAEVKFPPRDEIPPVEEANMADIQTRHATYSALLSQLTLFRVHRKNLVERGLSVAQIERNEYRSVPTRGIQPLVGRLLGMGFQLEGVPGFFIGKDGKWTVRFNSFVAGMLIPVRTMDGLIQAFQIRLDVPIDDDKYIWLSSAQKTMGCSAGAPVHFVGASDAEVVYFTEGALKADVASFLSEKSFCASAGAGQIRCWKQFFPILKSAGVKTLVESNDMDKYTNVAVFRGTMRALLLAHKLGFRTERIVWNPNPIVLPGLNKYAKGIDDHLLRAKVLYVLLQKYVLVLSRNNLPK